jgi:hypothetical protein
MPLSRRAHDLFLEYVSSADPELPHLRDDDRLFNFACYALLHDPNALDEAEALDALMSEYDFNDRMKIHVLEVLEAVPGLVRAYERARQGDDES